MRLKQQFSFTIAYRGYQLNQTVKNDCLDVDGFFNADNHDTLVKKPTISSTLLFEFSNTVYKSDRFLASLEYIKSI